MQATDNCEGQRSHSMRGSRKLFFFTLAAALWLASCSPPKYEPTIAFPCEWPGSPGFHGNIDQQEIKDPSGICFHPQRKTLFVVSDEGQVYEMQTDGTPLFRQRLPGDLEDITVDPATGLLYIPVEGADVILEYDPDRWEVVRRFPVNRQYGANPEYLKKLTDQYDNGLEALVFVPDEDHPEGGTFYAGNQEDPACLLELLVPLKSSQAPEAEARIIRVLPTKIRDPGALYYDGRRKLLYAVSDSDNILLEISLDGRIRKEWAFPGNGQEGLTWDDQGYFYIAQDPAGIFKLKDLRKNK